MFNYKFSLKKLIFTIFVYCRLRMVIFVLFFFGNNFFKNYSNSLTVLHINKIGEVQQYNLYIEISNNFDHILDKYRPLKISTFGVFNLPSSLRIVTCELSTQWFIIVFKFYVTRLYNTIQYCVTHPKLWLIFYFSKSSKLLFMAFVL